MSEQPAGAESDANESATDETQQQQTPETNPPAQSDAAQDDGTDWKAEAEKWKKLARKHEGQAKSNHTESQTSKQQLAAIAKALGMESEETPDPAKLQSALAERDELIWGIQLERAAEKAAAKHGADPELLVPVMFHGGKLDDIKPDSDDWESAVDKLAADMVQSNPKFRAGSSFPDLKQGNQGQSAAGSADPNAWLRQMAGRQ